MDDVRIGCHGLNGHQILGAFGHLKRARLVAVSGLDDEQYKDLCDKQSAVMKPARRYATLAEMLGDEDVDAVSLCSPRRDQQSADLIAAVRADKHVLAEKPLATTLDQLDELESVVRGADVKVVAMLGMSYYPLIRQMADAVRGGRIGEVVHVYAMKSYPYHDGRPQDRGVDGGLVCQAGVHAVDMIRAVTGLEVTEVFAWDTMVGNPEPGQLQMAGSVAMRFSNGAVGLLAVNYLNPKKMGFWGNDQLRVHGTCGMIEGVDGLTRATLAAVDDEPQSLAIDAPDHHEQTQDFIDWVLGQRAPHHTMDDSLRCTRVVLCAQKSADLGTPIACA